MKRIVKLNERDLTRIVKRVIKEGSADHLELEAEELRNEEMELIKNIKKFINKCTDLENKLPRISDEEFEKFEDDDVRYNLNHCFGTADQLFEALQNLDEIDYEDYD